VGLGKSHLLEGIHVELREQRPDARILHLTAEDFTNRFLGSIHAGKQTSFRRQFRDCDALLVDDLHFLARKTATQEEFLHTLEALQRDGRPVVVTCDCHPRLAEIFLPELTDRLAGGAVWGLSSPDLETRRRILESKMGDAIDPATLDFLAEKLRGNVRELEGALHSVRHLARVTDRPITPELAQEALAEVLRASVRTVQLADIEKAVSNVFGLGAGILQSRQRRAQIAYPRMLAMYLARKHTGATYSEVGHFFGKRNHSTVVAAEKKVRIWLTTKETLPIGTAKMAVKDLVDRFESELAR
jgi:chromosomal replication initiator protein